MEVREPIEAKKPAEPRRPDEFTVEDTSALVFIQSGFQARIAAAQPYVHPSYTDPEN